MREIVNTEKTYLSHMKTLCDLYMKTLRERCAAGTLGTVTSAELSEIFPRSTEAIRRIAENLLESLEKQLATAKSVDDLQFGRSVCCGDCVFSFLTSM